VFGEVLPVVFPEAFGGNVLQGEFVNVPIQYSDEECRICQFPTP
jgi:hypothetical protein